MYGYRQEDAVEGFRRASDVFRQQDDEGDAESALLYLDRVKACNELANPEIIISDLETKRIKFTITALIGDGKGRK